MELENTAVIGSDEASKRRYWFEHIKDWELSKLKQEAYCKQSGISYHSFVYWRGVYLSEAKPKKSKNNFIPMRLTTTPMQMEAPRAIQIKLISGHQVYLPMTMKLDDMVSLLRAIGAQHA